MMQIRTTNQEKLAGKKNEKHQMRDHHCHT
uniref:Uncharacterized protein n=1 Tax=Rhizophora mucronata TaxID=61149 RepID=A0A2P2Q0W3_RHIMU